MPIPSKFTPIWKLFWVLISVAAIHHQHASASEDKSGLDRRLASAGEIVRAMASSYKGPPEKVLEHAQCVAVVPHMVKAAFVFGKSPDGGVVSCRTEHGWSAPTFFDIAGGSWGLQVGVEGVDLIMIIQNARGKERLLSGKFSIGTDVSAAAGPVGRDSTGIDWNSNAEILTYSRARGVFAGISLDGAKVRSDESSVQEYYGEGVTSTKVLSGRVTPRENAAQFVQSVSKYFGADRTTASRPGAEAGTPGAKPESPANNYQVVRIFFATDRAPGESTADLQNFTGTRSPSESLTLGVGEVSIPRDHKMGELEEPSLLRLEFRPDPEKHIVLLKSKVLTASAFKAALKDKLSEDAKKRVLVFVHGYNVSFQEGAQRLGQITYDLGFSGAPILYSWPSSGSLLGYGEDEASVEWSIPHFTAFLRSLHQDADIKSIYVIGHSMGNRLVANALKNLATDNSMLHPAISDVVMAAPDIDEGVFKQFADSLFSAASRITIYESSKDNALVTSHRFHGYARLGDTDPTVHVFRHYECIEASSLQTGFLGHSYIGDNDSILSDVYDLITNGLSASQRFRLTARQLNGLPYWSFKK